MVPSVVFLRKGRVRVCVLDGTFDSYCKHCPILLVWVCLCVRECMRFEIDR